MTGWTVQTVKALHRYTYSWVPNDIPPEQIDWSQYVPPLSFQALPRRWVVERTIAWMCRNRRMSKDYELLPATSETWISLSMVRLMLKRLTHEEAQPAFHYQRCA